MLTSAFHSPNTDEVTLLAEAGIIHALAIMGEIRDSRMDNFGSSRDRSEQLAVMDQGLDLAFPQLGSRLFQPVLILGSIFTKNSFSDGGAGSLAFMVQLGWFEGDLQAKKAEMDAAGLFCGMRFVRTPNDRKTSKAWEVMMKNRYQADRPKSKTQIQNSIQTHEILHKFVVSGK